ncbi:toxin [Streptomyces sp. HNM0574]|uniref:toxin n=1 Tax=Streptomyces sp. HNM0574 TaxID=2714954 RepID=UPI00146AD1AB|nr:toxin [Streptomyces sp. HNM0574]NLU68610.1 toxin [Streptomyces sp. HNM0574]
MSMRELRKECEAGLADLPLPAPFGIPALVANMEAARGRTILLRELPDRLARLHTACGLRLTSGDTSLVLYRRRPTDYQTQHVILHELCHEWFDHGHTLDASQLRRLLPVFDTSLISRVLGTEEPPPEEKDEDAALLDAFPAGARVQARAQYDTHDERVAELGASLIPRMARDVTSDDMVGRLANSLARPVAHQRAPQRRGLFRRRPKDPTDPKDSP